jgi:hypothetical protein
VIENRPGARLIVTDIALVALLGLLAASPLSDAYGGTRWLVAVGGGLLIGIAVALASSHLRLGPWTTALATVVAYLLLGSALAAPEQAGAGVLPTPDSLRALLEGVVTAWRDSVTMFAPLGSDGNVLVVPYVIGLLSGLLSGLLLWRSRWPGAAALVLLAAFVVSAAFGDRLTELAPARGLALAIGLLVWTRWRATRDVRATWSRRLVLSLLTLSLAGGAAFGLTTLTSGSVRDVLRDHVTPPFDPLDYASPLSRYRAFYDKKGLGEKTMFTSSGLAKGDRVRIATMDRFDGIVWNLAGGIDAATRSGSFGHMVPAPESPSDRRISVTIQDYSGPWIPTFGDTRDVTVRHGTDGDDSKRSRVLYNKVTGTLVQVGGVQQGATYELRSVPPNSPPHPEELQADTAILTDPPAEVPALTKRVQRWLAAAGGPSGGGLAAMLEEKFQLGFYSDGKAGQAPSNAGHGVKRLTDLITPEDMIGNDEQYASAMAVAAQAAGLSARVVLGFVVPDDTGVVTGTDIHAWVEVKLRRAGWVTFRPTPDKSRTPKQQQNDPLPEPQPVVLQPPVVPKAPNDLDAVSPQGAGKQRRHHVADTLRAVVVALTYAGIAGILSSPVWLLLFAKSLRRRTRRNADDVEARVSGGWLEILDRARDHGAKLPASNTRYENGVVLVQRFPAAEAVDLAVVADRHLFGPRRPTGEDAAAYWAAVDSALERIRASAPAWRRPLAAVSPASIPWARIRDLVRARIGAVVARVGAAERVVALRRSLARSAAFARIARRIKRRRGWRYG